jgi:hypothetical protein
MSKVFTSKQFIDKLKWLTTIPNVYHSGTGWSTLKNGKWQFDCILSIKCILWGFKADKNLFRGGTKYESNGVPDFACNSIYENCSNVSKDFNNLVPGEYLCMKGTKHNHAGIYLGNGKVFECTTGWGVNRCIISDIDSKGIRSYRGVKNCYWTYHGKLNYIDYNDSPQPTPTPPTKLYYQGYDLNKRYWLPKVIIGSGDYIGNKGNYLSAFRVEDAIFIGHDYNKGYWLPEVNNFKSYAGNIGNILDGVAVKLKSGKKIKYRVWLKNGRCLPWVTGYNIKDNKNGYAGNIGQPISCLEIEYLD